MIAGIKAGRATCAIALASILSLALCAPALAFAADAPTASDEGTVTEPDGTKESVITGTVRATTITVTVPTQVAFYIDPGKDQSAALDGTFGAGHNEIGQYVNPTNFTITNRSAVDVYGYVSSVASPHVTLVNSGSLSKPGGVAPSVANKGDIKVMVGLGDATEADMALGTPGNWLTESIADTKDGRYYAFNKTQHGKLAAATANAGSGGTVSDDGAATITIRGAVFQGGWSQHDTFLIKPTFKIVTDPAALV